jgi:hypothetical protein
LLVLKKGLENRKERDHKTMPIIIKEYNKFVGGTNPVDQKINRYKTRVLVNKL